MRGAVKTPSMSIEPAPHQASFSSTFSEVFNHGFHRPDEAPESKRLSDATPAAASCAPVSDSSTAPDATAALSVRLFAEDNVQI